MFSSGIKLSGEDKKGTGFVKLKNKILKSNSPYIKDISDMWKEFKKRIITGTVTIAAVCSVCFAVNTLDLKLGYEVIIDGETIALVTEQNSVYEAIDGVRADMLKYMGDGSYSKSPVFVFRMVSGKNLASAEDMKEHLLSHLNYMVDCYGIYVEGEPVLGVTSDEAAGWILDKYKKDSVSEEIADSAEVDFVEKVEVKSGHLHISLLKTPEEALKLLGGEDNLQGREYTVQAEDTIWKIANSNNISVERILALNEGIGENIKEGDVIRLEENVPVISVRTVRSSEYTEELPYEVEKIKDSDLYEDTTVVSQPGMSGESRVLAKITEVNGVETSREVLKSEVTREPVKQIEKVGTKKRPATTGSGTFIKPSYGSLSSRYGKRWDRSHNGIDIAGEYNSSIKAADGGIVTYSGWMDGYGNYVVINHENGYETAYGHCSSLLVSVGQRVAKGDVIAKMGNTGRSTGTHLHFEVKKNGEFQNPLDYVGY